MYVLTHCSTKLSLDWVFIIFALIQGLLISHALVLCPPKLHHNERTQNAMNKTTSSGADRLVTSPIISTRTNTILKVMEAIGIPYYDCSPNYLCNELGESVAVITYL
jgi:hypothetical protein